MLTVWPYVSQLPPQVPVSSNNNSNFRAKTDINHPYLFHDQWVSLFRNQTFHHWCVQLALILEQHCSAWVYWLEFLIVFSAAQFSICPVVLFTWNSTQDLLMGTYCFISASGSPTGPRYQARKWARMAQGSCALRTPVSAEVAIQPSGSHCKAQQTRMHKHNTMTRKHEPDVA